MLLLPGYEDGRVERLAFTADGEWLASIATHPRDAERSAPVRLWNRFNASQKYLRPRPRHYGRCLALSPDGQLSAWSSWTTRDVVLCIWDNLAGEIASISGLAMPNHAVAFSHQLNLVAMSSYNRISLYQTVTGLLHQSFQLQQIIGRSRLDEHDHDEPDTLMFTPNDLSIAIGHRNAALTIFNHSGEQFARQLRAPAGSRPTLAVSESLLAVSAGGSIEVLDLKSADLLWSLPDDPKVRTSLAFSPDGQTLAVASGQSVSLYESFRGIRLAGYSWNIGQLGAVAFAPDGLTCAVGGEEGRIVIWDLDDA